MEKTRNPRGLHVEIRCKSSGSQHAEKTHRTRVIHVDYMWKLGVSSGYVEKTRRTRVIHVDYMWKLGVKVVEIYT